MKYNWTKENIESVIEDCDSFSDVLRKLNIPIQGNNCVTLKKKVLLYNIDFSHFTYGNKKKVGWKHKNIEEYLIKGSTIKSAKLKNRLIKEGYKENKCEICGISEWNGKPIVCQLHHIDGDVTNNELSNLQILCPNCHSQTDNYCGNANKSERLCPYCGNTMNYGSKMCVKCYNNMPN